jgi:hypothetical protein
VKTSPSRAWKVSTFGALVTPWILVAAAGAAVSLRQEQPGAEVAGATAVEAKPNSALILAVQGNVRVRTAPDAEWLKAEVGHSVLSGGAIQTGPRSAVQVQIGSGQVITIDRISNVEVAELLNAEQTDVTRLGVDYGRVLFQVKQAGFANDVQIQSADATLAVKGTEGGIDVNSELGTLSFGTETNDGTFIVTYPDGTQSDVSGDDGTSTENKDTAENENQNTEEDTGDPNSRESDEEEVSNRSAGGSD